MTAEINVTVEEAVANNGKFKEHTVSLLKGRSGATEEVKINMENSGFLNTATDAVSGICTPQGEETFTQEKDAPEVSVRVYDFEMVKQKTLPRNRDSCKFLICCSSLSNRTSVLIGSILVALFIITTIILIWAFAID